MIDLTFKNGLMVTRYVFAFFFAMISLNVNAQDESTQYRRPNQPEEKWDLFHNELITFRFLSQSADGHRTYCRADGSGYSPGGYVYSESYRRIIDEKEYFRIVIYTPNSTPTWYDYREEGDKLYRYNEEKKQDELFMDFGLNVGDVFNRPDGVKLQVVEVDDTLMNEYDGALKVLKLEGVVDKNVKDKWVECFGSVKTGIMLADDLPGYHITDMLYVEKENTDSYLRTALTRGIYNEISNSYLSSVLFNVKDLLSGETTKQNITYEEGYGLPLELSVVQTYQYMYFYLFQERDENLKCHSIPCGDYHLVYSSSQQTCNANIGLNFPSGDYSLYNASGKFIQNVTIGGDADAIDAIENDVSTSKQSNGSLFDLTGRRLSTSPQRGIYIQDGRKVFK